MIVDRFHRVLDVYIYSIQSTFVSGCFILDNVLLAYELLHSFYQKISGKIKFMALKLDMNKAYDNIEWSL